MSRVSTTITQIDLQKQRTRNTKFKVFGGQKERSIFDKHVLDLANKCVPLKIALLWSVGAIFYKKTVEKSAVFYIWNL